MANSHHSSLSTEYLTPIEIVEASQAVLGKIDLDPASSTTANIRIKAKKIFTPKEYGFLRKWRGKVFLNPPGGRCDVEGLSVHHASQVGYVYEHNNSLCEGKTQSASKAWWGKLALSYRKGYVTEAIFIGFSIEILQTAQSLVHDMHPARFAMCVPSSRLKFDRIIDGQVWSATAPTHANVIIHLGKHHGMFIEQFKGFGDILNGSR